MDIVLTKEFLQQALYELGSYGALHINVKTDNNVTVNIQYNIYSVNARLEMVGYCAVSTTNAKDGKIIALLSK